MVAINGETYYTVEDVVERAGGTEQNARYHCLIVSAGWNGEEKHYERSPYRMTYEQFWEVLYRISKCGRRSRKQPGQAENTPVICGISLF